MIDLETFIKSLKLCWLKRLTASGDKALLKQNLFFWGKLLFE